MGLFTKQKPPEPRGAPLEPDQFDRRQVARGPREQAEKEFEEAKQALADADATLGRLRAEYVSFPDRIQFEQFRFTQALVAYNKAKQKLEAQ